MVWSKARLPFHATLSQQLTIAPLLRYAIVTRPVRQGRLKLALEEVLSSRPDPNDPSVLQTPHDAAAAAPSSSGSSLQLASSPGRRPPHGMLQTALRHNGVASGQNGKAPWQNGNVPGQVASLQKRQDSHQISGLLSNGSSTSGSLLPSPCELAPLQSVDSLAGSNPSSQGAELENALQTRRHSLHRAPKVCPFLAHCPYGFYPSPKYLPSIPLPPSLHAPTQSPPTQETAVLIISSHHT